MNVGAPTSLPVAGSNGLEKLRQQQPETMEQEKVRLKLATKEFESFFVYYMLKNMRKTIPENPFANDVALGSTAGKEIFTFGTPILISIRMPESSSGISSTATGPGIIYPITIIGTAFMPVSQI